MADRLPFDISDDRMARAAWSRLAEPRDAQAGALVQALGAAPALEWLTAAARAWTDPPVLAPGAHWHTAAKRWIPRLTGLDLRRELDVLARRGGRVLVPDDPQWPAALADLGTRSPPCLWLLGDPEALSRPAVAVVGSRACSPYGAEITNTLTTELAADGLVIVSGGAFGVDAAAHRATLAGDGVPVAVMAGGLDRFYPLGNAALLAEVARRGAVVSEVPPGSSPMLNDSSPEQADRRPGRSHCSGGGVLALRGAEHCRARRGAGAYRGRGPWSGDFFHLRRLPPADPRGGGVRDRGR